AQTLRASVFGLEVTNFLDAHGDKIKVEISAQKPAVNSIDALLAMPLQTPAGQLITLQQVLKVDLNTSINTIRHKDGKRTVTVTADVRPGFNSNQITQELQKRLNAWALPDGYSITYGGEQQDTQETFSQLYRSMVVAL